MDVYLIIYYDLTRTLWKIIEVIINRIKKHCWIIYNTPPTVFESARNRFSFVNFRSIDRSPRALQSHTATKDAEVVYGTGDSLNGTQYSCSGVHSRSKTWNAASVSAVSSCVRRGTARRATACSARCVRARTHTCWTPHEHTQTVSTFGGHTPSEVQMGRRREGTKNRGKSEKDV